MFQNIETHTGLAYVLVMHLDPDHESMMAELLSSKTRVEVRQIVDNDHLQVDCLHVIPPGSGLRIEDGKLRLDPFAEPRGLRRPIDSFFTSLAQTQGDKSACVVLSGTGGDGTAGLRIVKEFGGICAVQSPEEARYDGMPFSALATKLVDFTLPADEILPRIKSFFEGAFQPRLPEDEQASQEALQKIAEILKHSLGNDFSGYKRSTLFRRLNRRMQVLEIETVEQYLELLETDEPEQVALARDFLINVTSFFRDRENFELLRKAVIVPLLESAQASDEIRIWVPGCSSGQEAYSIAMMVDQTCAELERKPLIQIFATDVEAGMIDHARRATYPVSTFDELPTRYQDAYTVAQDEKFEIVSKIREMVRFSVHNFIQDPPFSKVDLISCRNLMIYLGENLQSNLFPLMHFSLRPGGHLFLGTSESITRSSDLFTAVDQRARIFKRNDAAKRTHLNLPLGGGQSENAWRRNSQRMSHERDFPRHHSLDASNVSIYERYAPPFLRVTHDGKIIDSSGDLSLFIMSRPGDERSLDALARDAVRDVAIPLITDAARSGEQRAIKDVEIDSPFGTQKADIVAHPMRDQTVALIFLVKDRLKPLVDQFEVRPVTRDRRIADLQEELQATRLTLKGKVEEIETANEELKSSNEEMMSMNEELQSANEELTTANEELKNKIDELTLANADLDNFLQSADLAMIVLDRQMRIRHVTDAARHLMPLLRSDEGRSLSQFNIAVGKLNLAEEIDAVMESGEAFTQTTEANAEGRSFFLRITPYFFADGSVEGTSIALIDISKEVELRHNLAVEKEKLVLALDAAGMGSWDTDLETGEMQIDRAAAQFGGLEGPGIVARDAFFANMVPDDVEEFVKLRNNALLSGEGYSFTARVLNPGEDTRWMQVHAKPYVTAEGRQKVSGLGFEVTETMKLQQDLKEESRRLRLALNTGRMGLAELDVETRVTTADEVLAEQLHLGSAGDYSREDLSKFIVDDDLALIDQNLNKAIKHGKEYEFDFRVDVPGEEIRWIRSRAFLYTSDDGRKKVIAPTVDVTANEKQKMLVGEMSHRIKNLFAVIGGLIEATPKENDETKEMAESLLARIISLGKVYDLARKDTSVPGLPLRDLLRSVLMPHASAQEVTFDGPEVFVDREALNTFTLIVHELATNAAKYGALGSASGKLKVTWSADQDGKTNLHWKEEVVDFIPPQEETGFGSNLVDSAVRQLRGKFNRDYTSKGTVIDLTLHLS